MKRSKVNREEKKNCMIIDDDDDQIFFPMNIFCVSVCSFGFIESPQLVFNEPTTTTTQARTG